MSKKTLRISSLFLLAVLVLSLLFVAFKYNFDKNKHPKVHRGSELYYEIFVASFRDANNDGIGDLRGVISKLDYLKDLGVTGIWLMPIMPSQTYHKYDVDGYYKIDPAYGTMEDFENLITEAKKRGIKIIIDLVLNHTSDTHPWFVKAKEAVLKKQESPYINYYNFSEEAKSGYKRIADKIYYEARFWEEMPDLNLANPKLREEIKKIAHFWLKKGVAGFRLDAVLHFFEKNTSQNNEFLSWFMQVVKEKKEDAFVVGEAWTSENVILDYYKSGISSLFNFPFSGSDGKIAKSIRTKEGRDLAKDFVNYQNKVTEHHSSFLSNHDQGRSAAYFLNDEQRKIAAASYILSPSIPFVYYGEEIGMRGSGKDENKRLAMLWPDGINAKSPAHADFDPRKQIIVDLENNEESIEGKKTKDFFAYYRQIMRARAFYMPKNMRAKALDLHENIYSLEYDDVIFLINFSDKNIEVDLKNKIEDDFVKIDEISIANEIKINDQIIKINESSYANKFLKMAPYASIILQRKR